MTFGLFVDICATIAGDVWRNREQVRGDWKNREDIGGSVTVVAGGLEQTSAAASSASLDRSRSTFGLFLDKDSLIADDVRQNGEDGDASDIEQTGDDGQSLLA